MKARRPVSTLGWQALICVTVLSIWQWGYDLHARAAWLVPDLLDPYFVSRGCGSGSEAVAAAPQSGIATATLCHGRSRSRSPAYFGEGPVWDRRKGRFLWVDIIGDTIYQWTPGVEKPVLVHPSSHANGMTFWLYYS